MNRPVVEINNNPVSRLAAVEHLNPRLPDMHGTRIPLYEQQPAIRPSSIHESRAGPKPSRDLREVSLEEAALRPADKDRPAICQANNGPLSRVETTRSTFPVIGAPVIVMRVDWSRPTRIAHVDQLSAHGDALAQSQYSRYRAPIGTRQPAARAASNRNRT